MKRKITLSIALVLSVALLALMSSDSTANAASDAGFVADTGVMTLGPNQVLRITAVVPQRSQVRSLTVSFDRQVNFHGSCNSSGVCVHPIASRTTTESLTLLPGQGASIDIAQPTNASAVRGEMRMSIDMRPDERPDVEVNALIIDATTGAVASSNKLFVGGLSW
jgi:hypothetical protein